MSEQDQHLDPFERLEGLLAKHAEIEAGISLTTIPEVRTALQTAQDIARVAIKETTADPSVVEAMEKYKSEEAVAAEISILREVTTGILSEEQVEEAVENIRKRRAIVAKALGMFGLDETAEVVETVSVDDDDTGDTNRAGDVPEPTEARQLPNSEEPATATTEPNDTEINTTAALPAENTADQPIADTSDQKDVSNETDRSPEPVTLVVYGDNQFIGVEGRTEVLFLTPKQGDVGIVRAEHKLKAIEILSARGAAGVKPRDLVIEVFGLDGSNIDKLKVAERFTPIRNLLKGLNTLIPGLIDEVGNRSSLRYCMTNRVESIKTEPTIPDRTKSSGTRTPVDIAPPEVSTPHISNYLRNRIEHERTLGSEQYKEIFTVAETLGLALNFDDAYGELEANDPVSVIRAALADVIAVARSTQRAIEQDPSIMSKGRLIKVGETISPKKFVEAFMDESRTILNWASQLPEDDPTYKLFAMIEELITTNQLTKDCIFDRLNPKVSPTLILPKRSARN